MNCPISSEHFKVEMKMQTADTIKMLVCRKIDMTNLHDFQVVEALLHMWSENELSDEI